MTSDNDSERRLWARLWRRHGRWWLLGIPVGGLLMFIIGAGALGAFNATMHASNSLEFCTSCHEMGSFIYPEYKKSPHFQNQSGVRAICADCHVPKGWFPKLARKIQATFVEVPNHLLGTIGTREKFEAHREELAERVWARMRANNSQSCRNCHSYEAMALQMQGRSASKKHSPEWRERFDDTCIDCHMGVAHELPDVNPS